MTAARPLDPRVGKQLLLDAIGPPSGFFLVADSD
jgi:hypothetical protein